MPLLEMKGISKVYEQGQIQVNALQGIDLTVEEGEFISIAGPSGSGKTTLLNLIGCLDTPSAGSIQLTGQEISKMSRSELAMVRRNNLGFIFQSYNLIPVLTVYENVEFSLKILSGYSQAEVKKRVMEILEAVGLGGLENRKPNELSGGQKQRVAIARALVKEPKLILADEPTANLDSKTSVSVLEIMKKMNQQYGATFIFSTHDSLVMNEARRLITIRDGKLVGEERRGEHVSSQTRVKELNKA